MKKRFKQFLYTQAKDYDEFQKKFEDTLGWSISKIKFIASGKQKINILIAEELEEKFNLNPCWLCFGQGEMYHPKIPLNEEIKSKDELTNDMDILREELKELRALLTK